MISDNKITEFFLLDMTGSMANNKEGTLSAFNEYISGLKDNEHTRDNKFNLSVFNNYIGVRPLVVNKPVSELGELESSEYKPSDMTPLYDAIGKTIQEAERVADESKIIIVVQTDGLENTSKEYKKADIVSLIEEKKKEGWQFVFIGCDIDAMGEGAKIGLDAGTTLTYDRANPSKGFSKLRSARVAYASTGGMQTNSFFTE